MGDLEKILSVYKTLPDVYSHIPKSSTNVRIIPTDKMLLCDYRRKFEISWLEDIIKHMNKGVKYDHIFNITNNETCPNYDFMVKRFLASNNTVKPPFYSTLVKWIIENPYLEITDELLYP